MELPQLNVEMKLCHIRPANGEYHVLMLSFPFFLGGGRELLFLLLSFYDLITWDHFVYPPFRRQTLHKQRRDDDS